MGSAKRSSGTLATTAMMNRMMNATATPTVSLKTCSGKNLRLGAVSPGRRPIAVLAHQIDVNADQDDRQRRKQNGVERVESREGDIADAVALAAKQSQHIRP